MPVHRSTSTLFAGRHARKALGPPCLLGQSSRLSVVPKDDSHVKRSPNKFMLFRSDFIRTEEGSKLQVQNSKAASVAWNAKSDEEKEPYREEARRLKAELYAKHPNFQWNKPASQRKTKATSKKAKPAVGASKAVAKTNRRSTRPGSSVANRDFGPSGHQHVDDSPPSPLYDFLVPYGWAAELTSDVATDLPPREEVTQPLDASSNVVAQGCRGYDQADALEDPKMYTEGVQACVSIDAHGLMHGQTPLYGGTATVHGWSDNASFPSAPAPNATNFSAQFGSQPNGTMSWPPAPDAAPALTAEDRRFWASQPLPAYEGGEGHVTDEERALAEMIFAPAGLEAFGATPPASAFRRGPASPAYAQAPLLSQAGWAAGGAFYEHRRAIAHDLYWCDPYAM
ncbi:hypothetical protein BD626DRAFT_502100 [Schizophyllum amplum]|uniref:HMG box domain-containing protein n=1 Tax=Schizophyllum amplum TaxID=97359 RepID=A0A550C929_9AGAR|nr:hypothetical protein BD626DRAFT_502100 [Auriculariopsis ampla]